MPDAKDKIIEEAVRKYGTLAVISAGLIIGSTIWLLSHVAGEPGERVIVLWGLTDYVKRSDNSASCKSLAGLWTSSSDYQLNLTQEGCTVHGNVFTVSNASHQSEIDFTISGLNGFGYITRTLNGCTITQGIETKITPSTQNDAMVLTVQTSGQGCDINNWQRYKTAYTRRS